MRPLIATLTVAGALAFAGAASAAVPTQTFTVVNLTHLTDKQVRKAELAVSVQSWELHYWWHTPIAKFGPGGWKVTIVAGDQMYKQDLGGYHDVDQGGNPYAVVSVQVDWTGFFSHEVMETLEDPFTAKYSDGTLAPQAGIEVCDPVEAVNYRVRGVWVSDFATPSYFNHTPGRQSETGVTLTETSS